MVDFNKVGVDFNTALAMEANFNSLVNFESLIVNCLFKVVHSFIEEA